MTQSTNFRHHRAALGVVLAVTFALGLVRIAFVPVWMHYDEPSHYEYVRYIVKHGKLPTEGQPDNTIIKYLEALDPEHHYQADTCQQIDLNTVCWYPAQQFNEVPGYYVIQAAAHALIRPVSLAGQIALGRLISVGMAVGVAAIMFGTILRLFPGRPLLAAAVPIIMAGNFAYMDLMSALNNDVGAVLAFHLLLLALVTVIVRGFTWGWVGLLVTSLALCVVMKSSSWIGLPVAALGVGLALVQRMRIMHQIAILALIGLAGAAILFYWEPGIGPLIRPMYDQVISVDHGANYHLVGWYDPQNWPIYWPAIRWQFVTFWSAFGTGLPGLPVAGVVIFAALTGVSLIGLARLLITGHRKITRAQAQSLLFLSLTLFLVMLMSLIRIDPPDQSGSIYYMPTARHFYIAAGPAILLWVMGLGSWLTPPYRRYGLALLVLLLYAMSWWSLLGVQIPIYATWL